jgi:hypothetical protein
MSNNWTKKAISLLGTLSDKELAVKINISSQAVSYKRRKLGIATFKTFHTWTKEEDLLLGKITARDIAEN